MSKHRIGLRKWCVDCGTSQPLSSVAPHLEIVADCWVCENRATETATTGGVESTAMKPVPSVPCGDCGTGVAPRRLCDVCSTMRERARDRIWFAGVAMQELLQQAGSPCGEPPFRETTKAEIATESYKMADAMLAKSRKDQS